MKNKLFTLAAALTLAAVIGGVYAAPALAAVIKAALVKNVDEPGRTPFVVKLECVSPSSSSCSQTAPAIPSDRRFVVEHVHGFLRAANNVQMEDFRILKSATAFPFVPRFYASDSSSSEYVVNEPFRAYYEAGEVPTFQVTFNTIPATASPGTIVLIGYLIDLTI